jgi:hypothetical protein
MTYMWMGYNIKIDLEEVVSRKRGEGWIHLAQVRDQ